MCVYVGAITTKELKVWENTSPFKGINTLFKAGRLSIPKCRYNWKGPRNLDWMLACQGRNAGVLVVFAQFRHSSASEHTEAHLLGWHEKNSCLENAVASFPSERALLRILTKGLKPLTVCHGGIWVCADIPGQLCDSWFHWIPSVNHSTCQSFRSAGDRKLQFKVNGAKKLGCGFGHWRHGSESSLRISLFQDWICLFLLGFSSVLSPSRVESTISDAPGKSSLSCCKTQVQGQRGKKNHFYSQMIQAAAIDLTPLVQQDHMDIPKPSIMGEARRCWPTLVPWPWRTALPKELGVKNAVGLGSLEENKLMFATRRQSVDIGWQTFITT